MKKSKVKENNDVVLQFQHKDCVLANGLTKEDLKEDNVFFHEIYEGDKINQLLAPKVFCNAKRYTQDGIEENITYNSNDNLIIKGNNLITIASLLSKFENSIKLIYIDPPYNTGSTGFSYNDSFNRSTWLTFMKNRLEIAKKLLSDDGAIYIHLDYHQVHYCKVLMDEIFGENNFQREIIWRIGWLSGYKSKQKNWVRNHDTLLFYSKNNSLLKFVKKTIHNNEFKSYVKGEEFKKLKELLKQYNLSINDIKKITEHINHTIRPEKYDIDDVWNGNEYDNLNSIAIVSFSGETISKMLNPEDEIKGQKSEKLIKRIIDAHTVPGDIILDFFSGSGTTGAVAMKMNRKFILCEQIDKHIDISVSRLHKVIEGEQSGISKSVNWQGGGSFVYCELKEITETLKSEIQSTDDKYINFSDIDDEKYNVSEADKKFTKSFYNN